MGSMGAGDRSWLPNVAASARQTASFRGLALAVPLPNMYQPCSPILAAAARGLASGKIRRDTTTDGVPPRCHSKCCEVSRLLWEHGWFKTENRQPAWPMSARRNLSPSPAVEIAPDRGERGARQSVQHSRATRGARARGPCRLDEALLLSSAGMWQFTGPSHPSRVQTLGGISRPMSGSRGTADKFRCPPADQASLEASNGARRSC